MIAALLFLASVAGQTPPSEDGAKSTPREVTAASVDGEAISSREVEREFDLAVRQKNVTPDARRMLLAKTLEQLISRRLVVRWLSETKQGASQADVEFALEQLKINLVRRGSSMEEFLRSQKLDDAGLRRSLTWQVAWQRFLGRYLTDANLEKYFQQHRPDFDGTEVRVAHILFPVERPDEPESLTATRNRAQRLLETIRAGKVTFADAAREHSTGPSREQGGDIGWIERREPMPESFSQAAFALERKQVSDPVVTTFGVHLIECLDIRPGQKLWMDVRAELEQAVTKYLFEWAAGQIRPRAMIEYSEEFPHFRPGTDVLAN